MGGSAGPDKGWFTAGPCELSYRVPGLQDSCTEHRLSGNVKSVASTALNLTVWPVVSATMA